VLSCVILCIIIYTIIIKYILFYKKLSIKPQLTLIILIPSTPVVLTDINTCFPNYLLHTAKYHHYLIPHIMYCLQFAGRVHK